MSIKLGYLKDKDGNKVMPITTPKQVRMGYLSDETLEEKLAEINTSFESVSKTATSNYNTLLEKINTNQTTLLDKIAYGNVGSTTTPIFFKEGIPTACGYTIEKSVPADAVFTDTTYGAAGSALGLVQSGGNVTISNGVITVNTSAQTNAMYIPRMTKSILDIAAEVALRTEVVYFGGSDAVSTGKCPQTYCIVNIKKGDNHRTILDCYHLNTGDHYINGNMDARYPENWTGWVLQPNGSSFYTKTEIDTKIPTWTANYEGASLRIVNGSPAWVKYTFILDGTTYLFYEDGMTMMDWISSEQNTAGVAWSSDTGSFHLNRYELYYNDTITLDEDFQLIDGMVLTLASTEIPS